MLVQLPAIPPDAKQHQGDQHHNDPDPDKHLDAPQQPGRTIRQMLCGVNPQSRAAVGLNLSQIDSGLGSATASG